jgi:ABC-type transport system substrate-binding protein
MENDGARFRFRLRPGVRFHNGRRLTARDVRHSWERLLLNRQSESRWVLAPVQGAQRMLDGLAADLAGFHIVSPTEFYVDLENPVPFFPAMISYNATAIVPEGTGAIGTTAREGAIGTGPFRVVSFEPGRRLELERNPHYWRAGLPRSEGIVFHLGITRRRPAPSSSPSACRSRAISCLPTPRRSATTRALPRATARARAWRPTSSSSTAAAVRS